MGEKMSYLGALPIEWAGNSSPVGERLVCQWHKAFRVIGDSKN